MGEPFAGVPASAASAPPATGRAPSTAVLESAAQEFEGIFLAQFLDGLTAGLAPDGGGGEQDAYRDMLNDEMAQLISRTGGIGVADAVLREMLKMQEVA